MVPLSAPGLPLQVAASAMWCVPRPLVEWSDVLHLSTVRAAAMIDVEDRSRAHLDYVDALSRNTRQRSQTAVLKALWRFEADRLASFEQALGRTVASCSCTTEEDRLALDVRSVEVIPFGVDVPASVPAEAAHPTVLFPGNLGYFANVDAAVWLANDIFPLVREVVPNARLLLVGARPTREIRALARAGIVEVHADVDAMTPFYGRAWVVAAPLRYGTGLQTKVLEAFAHQRPVVVTTGVAARVPGVTVGRELEAADDRQALAERIIRLLREPSERRRLSAAGLEVARDLSWDRCAMDLEATYRPSR